MISQKIFRKPVKRLVWTMLMSAAQGGTSTATMFLSCRLCSVDLRRRERPWSFGEDVGGNGGGGGGDGVADVRCELQDSSFVPS